MLVWSTKSIVIQLIGHFLQFEKLLVCPGQGVMPIIGGIP